MFEKLNKKVQSILTGVDSDALQHSLETVAELMETEEGQKLMEQFNSIDKQELVQNFSKMNEDEIIEQLDNINLNELSGKMNDLEKEQIAKVLSDNPKIINKFDKFIDNK